MSFSLSKSILGMNARNLQYISKYNSASDKKFADDKIFTKQFLQSRGIGVAKLFHIIKNYRQLTDDFFAALPESFVIKPNRGLAGHGIIVITKKTGKHWVTAGGKKIDKDSLYRHCVEILEGKYSISGVSDRVIFEERLEPHPDLRKVCELGLPDIRVIVFNMVPVMAMMRVPTYESEGKANMELGAIAMGIDMVTGKTNGAAQKSIRVKRMPTGASVKGFQIPFWDDILYATSKIQESTKIGFLGVDIVVSKTGIKVLEVNARPGLKIQVANNVPLRRRLDKVVDLKVLTPEDGVSIAKTLFSDRGMVLKDEEVLDKPVIGVKEVAVLNAEKPQNITVEVRLGLEKSIMSKQYHDGGVADITLSGKRLKLPVEKGNTGDVDILLAGKYLTDFYIDPNKKFDVSEIKNISQTVTERKLKNIDEKVAEIDEQIKLLSYINPRNLEEQRKVFFEHPEFNPRFLYKDCELDIESLRRELKRIPRLDHPLYPLYAKKIESLEYKLALIETRGTEEFSDWSEKLFGAATRYMYREAVSFIKSHPEEDGPDPSEELDFKETTEVLEAFLRKHKLSHWKIKSIEDSVADIQVTKKNSILLKKGATFQKNRLEALLVHEIGTHVFRYENGKTQPLRILERGTANYLQTEEGLAIWNQNQLGLHLGQKFFQPAMLVVAIHMAAKMGFCDLFHYLKETYALTDDEAWKLCVKSKRGLINTENTGAFTKDVMYFYGYRDIQKYLKRGGQIKDLYAGKYAIEDLEMVQSLEGLVEPKYLL